MSDRLPKAIMQGSIDIGGTIIPCAVLDDETRVLRERSIANALGKKGSGWYWQRKRSEEEAEILPEYVSAKLLDKYISQDLREKLLSRIRYKTKSGSEAWGVSATLLPEICNVWLDARDQNSLTIEQMETAKKAEILMRGLAHVGIIALVDEATGYQEIRDRKALEVIIERYIAKELSAWAKTFPDEFYEQLFRLRDWQYKPLTVKRPRVVGRFTEDIVYKRLETGVLNELKTINPKTDRGYRKYKHFQWLTEDFGNPKLKHHLSGVIALMKAAPNWPVFMRMLNTAFPKKGATLEMPLDDLGTPED